MSLGKISEEKLLVVSISFNPLSELRGLNKLYISLCLVELGFLSKQKLLVVSVVENIWVLSPS